jgi:RNA polymerase sigma-70 factor (ECF subfamily)
MERARQLEPEERPESPGTLGDVLYPDRSKARISEQDWVRLVRAVAAGDPLALHALYERAHRVVFTLIMRITSHRETAEELTLDVFHDVWRRSSGYDPANGTVLGWIMNQARSRAIDRLRFEGRRKRRAPDAHPGTADLDARADRDWLEAGEQSRALRAALAFLTPDEHAVIEAAFFGESTHAEVAARLNLPLGTVKTRIRSALRKLRRALAAEAAKP